MSDNIEGSRLLALSPISQFRNLIHNRDFIFNQPREIPKTGFGEKAQWHEEEIWSKVGLGSVFGKQLVRGMERPGLALE